MRQFPIFLNLAGKKVILIGDGEMADTKRRLYERAGALITEQEDDPDARLAVVALGNPEEAKAAAERLRRSGLLINVVDHPELCDFTTPAIVDREPVLIAVGTGGASAGLAKALRQRLEALLPQSLGQLAWRLFKSRDMLREQFPDARVRRNAIDEALAEGGLLDPLSDLKDDKTADWLSGSQHEIENQLVEINLHSGDPDDLTLRQARLLARADNMLIASDVPGAILDRARADAHRQFVDAIPAAIPAGLTIFITMENTK